MILAFVLSNYISLSSIWIFICQMGYPTLNAFAEFICDFEIPGSPNTGINNPTPIDIGRPFSPAMFEVVLHKFTPNVSSSTSGRSRHVKFLNISLSIFNAILDLNLFLASRCTYFTYRTYIYM